MGVPILGPRQNSYYQQNPGSNEGKELGTKIGLGAGLAGLATIGGIAATGGLAAPAIPGVVGAGGVMGAAGAGGSALGLGGWLGASGLPMAGAALGGLIGGLSDKKPSAPTEQTSPAPQAVPMVSQSSPMQRALSSADQDPHQVLHEGLVALGKIDDPNIVGLAGPSIYQAYQKSYNQRFGGGIS